MKKFYSFLVAAVLLMGATSCQKEATADAGAADNVEFVASIAGGRTELGDGNKVMWNNGDMIRIFTRENFAGTEFNSDATAATATAKFTTTQSFTASNNGYLAVYPESANKTDNGFSSTVHNASYAEGVWSIPVNLSSGYGNPSNFPMAFEKNAFMVAFSNNNQLSFKAATALLKIKNIENGRGGSVKLFGANLCGEATLHYDTNNAENPISYTLGSGDSQFEYNFPEQNGETIYVPIYPGTVTGFEVYGDDWQNPLVTYNKTITFEAGVIYDLDLDNAPIGGGDEDTRPVSPWQLYNTEMGASVEMRIDGDYHVATLKQSGSFVITDTSMENIFGFAGEVANNQWYKTGVYNEGVTHGPAYLMAYESYPLDIYITEDAGWFCVVPQMGGELPAVPTQSAWCLRGDHNNWGNDGVPTTPMYDMGDYSVAYGVQFTAGQKFKFEHTGTWVGGVGTPTVGEWNYTGGSDIVVPDAGTYDIYCLKSDGGYLLLQTGSGSTVPQYIFPAEENCLYLKPNSNWNKDNARFAAYFYGNGDEWKWVSMERAGFNGYYKVEIPAGFPNVIFCRMNPNTTDNNWNDGVKWGQTGNLTISAANNAYTMTANSWDQGTWSKITEY